MSSSNTEPKRRGRPPGIRNGEGRSARARKQRQAALAELSSRALLSIEDAVHAAAVGSALECVRTLAYLAKHGGKEDEVRRRAALDLLAIAKLYASNRRSAVGVGESSGSAVSGLPASGQEAGQGSMGTVVLRPQRTGQTIAVNVREVTERLRASRLGTTPPPVPRGTGPIEGGPVSHTHSSTPLSSSGHQDNGAAERRER